MSWLFLAVSLWGAWFTWNALHPSPNSPRFAVVSFAAGWLTTELALHHVAWQAVATAVFGMLGAFDGWPGRFGLLITFASWAGLLVAQRKAHEAEGVLERALVEGLGADYRQHIEHSLRAKLSHRIDWWRVWKPFPIKREDVEIVKDIHFARERGTDLEVDVYRNVARPSGCPALFQIHGGGWTSARRTSRRCR